MTPLWESRPRAGKGGGLEYHIDSLPPVTQKALKLRQLINEFPFQLQTEYHGGTITPQCPIVEAKLWVLQCLERFNQFHNLTITAGRELFVKAFNHRLFNIPSQVQLEIGTASVGTLKRWDVLQRRSGFERLIPQFNGRISIIDRITAIKDIILSHITCSGEEIYAELQHKLGNIHLPRPRTINHWVQNWIKHNPLIHAKTTLTKSDFNHRFRRAVGRRDEKAKFRNSHWEIDATPTDIFLADGKRYTIIGVIDIFSRRCKFHVADKSNATNIIRGLLRQTILEWGVPDTVITDQGRDFCSVNFGAALTAIGAVQHICNPASGWEKPFIERLFGTMTRNAMKNLQGWIGANITERPDEINATLTAQDLQEKLDIWCEERYYKRPHNTLRMTPQEKWDSCERPTKRIDSERALDLLLAEIPSNQGMRTIAQKGVSIDGHWYSPADSNEGFWSRQGEAVQIKYDASGDAGFVMVYDRYGKFICEADCPELTGVSRIDRVRKMKDLKRTKKIIQKELTHLFHLDPDTDIQAITDKAIESIPADGYHIDQAHAALEHIIDITPISVTTESAEPAPETIEDIYLRYRQEFHTGNRLEDPETLEFFHRYEQAEINWHNVSKADLLYIIPPACRTTRSYEYTQELARSTPQLGRWHHSSNHWRTVERQLHLDAIPDPALDPNILATLTRCQSAPPYHPNLMWVGCDGWISKNLQPIA